MPWPDAAGKNHQWSGCKGNYTTVVLLDLENNRKYIHSLKPTVHTCQVAPTPKKIIFQPSLFRCELLVSENAATSRNYKSSKFNIFKNNFSNFDVWSAILAHPKTSTKKHYCPMDFPINSGLKPQNMDWNHPSWPADRLTPNMLNSIRLSRNALLLEILKFGGHTNWICIFGWCTNMTLIYTPEN